jgi:hypothetical protein
MMISMTTRMQRIIGRRIIDSFFIQEKAQMQKTFHLDKMKRLLFDLISVNTSIPVRKLAVSHKKTSHTPCC